MNVINEPNILVSVVVPTDCRPDLLERCLDALANQHFSRDRYEIIVCDEAGSDLTRRQVAVLADALAGRPAIRYVAVSDAHGPAAARNQGWRGANGEIVAFTDDDTIAAPDWLGQGVQAMTAGVAAVTGVTDMPIPNPPSDYERDAAGLTNAAFITANCFVRRSALVAVGGFDTRYTMAWREDSDLHFALLDRGYCIQQAPLARVLHPVRAFPFAAGLHMQKKLMFDMLLRRKYPDLYRQYIRAHPPSFYLCVTAVFLVAIALLMMGQFLAASIAIGAWLILSGWFFFKRLWGTRLSARNVADLIVTSIGIPLLAIGWRVVGLIRFQRQPA